MYTYNPELQKTLRAAGYTWAAESLNHPSDFGYHGDLDLFNTWGLCFSLENRDSGVLEQSNSAMIKAMIKDANLDDSFEVCTFNHWAVGWVETLAIKLVNEDGTINQPAIDFMQGIMDRLEDYPILDESDYSERAYNDSIETIQSCYKWDLENQGYTLPDNWEHDIYNWLSDNGHDTDSDYLSSKYIEQAASELFPIDGHCKVCKQELTDLDYDDTCLSCHQLQVQANQGITQLTLI